MQDIAEETAKLKELVDEPTTRLSKVMNPLEELFQEADEEECTGKCDHCGYECPDPDDVFCSPTCEELARYDAYGDDDC